jgi:NADH/F420H2 dehydrogenase subunit C
MHNVSNENVIYYKELLTMLPKYVQFITYSNNTITIEVESQYITEMLTFLKYHSNTRMTQLLEMTAVDYPQRNLRFEVVYMLLSIEWNTRVIVKTSISETTPLASVVSLYNSACWYEREIWDLYGIYFVNHPDLRRILTDYGFDGHPLRKDFPLSGYVEVRYDEEQKRVITEPLEMAQEFRAFDFTSPWEQINLNATLHMK